MRFIKPGRFLSLSVFRLTQVAPPLFLTSEKGCIHAVFLIPNRVKTRLDVICYQLLGLLKFKSKLYLIYTRDIVHTTALSGKKGKISE